MPTLNTGRAHTKKQQSRQETPEPPFSPELLRQLQRLERQLADSDGRCSIEIMGVAHIGDAGQEIIDKAKNAQIVTLELPRKVVRAGLDDERTKVFERNAFWKSMVNALGPVSDEKLVKGIEVNHTVRTALRRLTLHYGYGTLAPSSLTFELKKDSWPNEGECRSEDMDKFMELGLLEKQDFEKLQQHNWVVADNMELARLLMAVVAHNREQHGAPYSEEEWPIRISRDLYLVAVGSGRYACGGRGMTTFIKEPDESLQRAYDLVYSALAEPGLHLTLAERGTLSVVVLQTFLLSHSELKDAEEMAYFLCQYARKHKDEKEIRLLHIGGALHSEHIRQVLLSACPGSRIGISATVDPRLDHVRLDASIEAFFQDHIPLTDMLSAIKAEGFEVHAESERVADLVRQSIAEHRDDFDRRLLIRRLMREKDDGTIEQYRKVCNEEAYLVSLRPDVLLAKYMRMLPELGSRSDEDTEDPKKEGS
jgi:hypothetical protein